MTMNPNRRTIDCLSSSPWWLWAVVLVAGQQPQPPAAERGATAPRRRSRAVSRTWWATARSRRDPSAPTLTRKTAARTGVTVPGRGQELRAVTDGVLRVPIQRLADRAAHLQRLEPRPLSQISGTTCRDSGCSGSGQ